MVVVTLRPVHHLHRHRTHRRPTCLNAVGSHPLERHDVHDGLETRHGLARSTVGSRTNRLTRRPCSDRPGRSIYNTRSSARSGSARLRTSILTSTPNPLRRAIQHAIWRRFSGTRRQRPPSRERPSFTGVPDCAHSCENRIGWQCRGLSYSALHTLSPQAYDNRVHSGAVGTHDRSTTL